MPRNTEQIQRTCLVTRETLPVDQMIRFARSPDGQVAPDLKRRLPGRGVWVTARRHYVEEAVKKRVFARGFKTDCDVPAELGSWIDKMMSESALGVLGLALKGGFVVTGFSKVEAAITKTQFVGLVRASDAAEDGCRKVDRQVRRVIEDPATIPVIRCFRSEELNTALGRPNVIHVALLNAKASNGFFERVAVLEHFRAGPDAPNSIHQVATSDAHPQLEDRDSE